jgi:PQQ-dependent dehydrogenase (methanol/ethanol family)
VDGLKVRVVSVVVVLAVFAAVVLSACGGSGGTTTTSAASEQIGPDALAQSASPSDAELEAGAGANWPTVGGDISNTRFSSLNEIDTKNVGKLHLVWQGTYSPKLEATTLEEESSPLVVNGVMYMVTPEDNVVAVEAATGRKLWEWKAEVQESELRTEPPTGVQGLAVGDGMVFVETNAAKVVGIDVKTGQEAWSHVIALGETVLESPSTPLFYDGVVYVGVSGGESGRGHVDAYEAKTGKMLWRSFLVCGPTDQPPSSGKCPAGENNPNEGGGSVWTYPALDVKDGLLYVSTANPSSLNEVEGNFDWSDATVALEMKTGHIKWGFQGVHHDMWDYDCTTPPVLYENTFEGKKKSVVNFVCKSDYHFTLDQKTGKPDLPVSEEPAPTAAGGKTPDVASQEKLKASETQPIPANSDKSEVVPHCANENLLPNPAPDGTKYTYSCTFAAPGSKGFTAYGIGSSGGQDGKSPLAYDPETNAMYYCEMVSVEAQKLGEAARGGTYLGVNHGWQGSIAAVNVTDNTTDWNHKIMAPDGACRGGVTATAGGIVFGSANHGKLFAFDAATGKELWSYQGPSNIYAPPTVFEADGHEYVALYYGGQVPLVGGMTNEHYARMLVFSIEGEEQLSAEQMPKTEFAKTELEAFELAAAGKITPEEEQANALKGLEVEGESEEPSEEEGAAAEEEGAEEGGTAATGSAGESVFTTNCASCHTLAAAGAEGTVGPNLDQIHPSESIVEHQVINGGGGMPAFGKEKLLSTEEIEEVAEYVSSVAGAK